MSGVGSVSGQNVQGYWITSSVNQAYSSKPSKVGDPNKPTGMNEQMEAVLDRALDSTGIDQETRETLKAELEQAFGELFSGDTRPDPSQVKQTIDGVFEKFGLNGEDIMGQLRPHGGPRPGMGPPPGEAVGETDSEESSQTDLLETLLAQLNDSTEEDDGESDVRLTPQELAQRILDALFGFDEEA